MSGLPGLEPESLSDAIARMMLVVEDPCFRITVSEYCPPNQLIVLSPSTYFPLSEDDPPGLHFLVVQNVEAADDLRILAHDAGVKLVD